MRASLHGVFNLVFGNVEFVIVISNICGRKMRFSAGNQNFISEKSIFGHLEVIFLNGLSQIFLSAGVTISC